MLRRKHLRNLKNAGIVITLENITYNILIHTSRQRSAATVGLYTSPERELHIAQDWEIQITINHFMSRCGTNSSNLRIWKT
jgi:hypothetical protein